MLRSRPLRPKPRPKRDRSAEFASFSLDSMHKGVVMGRTTEAITPIPKDGALQHKGYMDIVRRMTCIHCHRDAPSQFAHADILGVGGKGMGIKSDCRLGYPACADSPGRLGCHHLIGSAGVFTKTQRHTLEEAYGWQTRMKVIIVGLWPSDLPPWPGDQRGMV